MAYTAAQAANALNETMGKLGYDYKIDTTDDTTIENGFKAVGAFPETMKSCILDMQMKILQTRAFSAMFSESNNPTRRFWRSAVDYGGGIQDIFVKLIEADPGFWASDFCEENNWGGYGSEDALAQAIAKDLVTYKKDNIINKIHVVTDKFRIKMSISDLEYAKVFTPAGYGDFISTKYNVFQSSVEANLMKITIKVIQKMVAEQHVVFTTGLSVNTPNEVTNTVETINATSDGMENLTSMYNYDGVETLTSFDDLYLVTTPAFWNRIKSRGYANAFNLEEYRNKNRLIMLPAGTKLGEDASGKEVGAILLDYRAVTVAIRYWEVGTFIVQNTDYRSSFNKLQLITGYTEFFNAVAFVTGDVAHFAPSNDYVLLSISNLSDAQESLKVNGAFPEFMENGDQKYNAQIPKGSFVEYKVPTNEARGISMGGVQLLTNLGGTLSAGDEVSFYAEDNIKVD